MRSPYLLEVEDLAVAARSRQRDIEIVHGVSLRLAPGETVAIVGETGSGKSLTMLALMRLLSPPLGITRRRVTHLGWQPDGAQRVEPRYGEPELRLRRTLDPR